MSVNSAADLKWVRGGVNQINLLTYSESVSEQTSRDSREVFAGPLSGDLEVHQFTALSPLIARSVRAFSFYCSYMPSTHHSITARWVGLEGLSCEELLQRFTDKQRRRIYSKRVLGLDACGNSLDTLTGLEAYTQLHSLSVARCKLHDLSSTVSPSCVDRTLFIQPSKLTCIAH